MKIVNHPNLDSQRWSLLQSLYHSASELAPEARHSFLAESCSGDDALFNDVLSLIRSHESTDSFLEEPVFSFDLQTLRLQREELAGTNIDRYQLTSRLGSGGMGDVYLAHDPRLNRRVALKLLNRAVLNDEQNLLRFDREARAASSITHTNVAHIYELGETDGRKFITMEYVDGPTLRQVMKQGPVSTERAVNFVAQILSALIAARKARVIHRDIKPENIIITEGDTVKVLDFGLAKILDPTNEESEVPAGGLPSLNATSGLLMGTSHYMSPEQVRRDPVDARTDLWSVGVVLYEMLCERRPFPGQDHGEVMDAVVEKPPLPFAAARRSVPRELQTLTLKALSKNPNDRFQTADEMLAALKGIKEPWVEAPTEPQATSGPGAGRSPLEIAFDDGATGANRRDQKTQLVSSPAEPLTPVARRLRRVQQAVAAILLLGIASSVIYFMFFWQRPRSFQIAFQPLNLSGVIEDIVRSPDGKSVASVQSRAGKQSIHVLDLATSTDVVVVPATGRTFGGLSFSPDSSYVYYLEGQTSTSTLFRVPRVGGAPRQLLTNVNTAVTFSPDGARIAFYRTSLTDDFTELVLTQADGSDARAIARRDRNTPDRFLLDMRGPGPVWSPDGQTIACPVAMRASRPQELRLYLIGVDGKEAERLSGVSWYEISQLTWLADNSGIVIAATPSFAAPSQLSLVSPDGSVRPLTNDLNNYTRISAAADSRQLLTLNQVSTSRVWKGPAELGGGYELFSFEQQNLIAEVGDSAPGKLVYTANDGMANHIWLLDPVGGGSRPLTSGTNQDWKPTLSPDGTQVVFVSMRQGKINLWTMGLNETEPHQLTTGAYDDAPSFSPDGKWVVYRGGGAIKRIPSQGGTPEVLLDDQGMSPVISPDGQSLAAFVQSEDKSRWELLIVDLASRQVRRLFIPEAVEELKALRWSLNGKSLAYVSVTDGVDNIWLHPVESGGATRLTTFSEGEIVSFAWGRDAARQLYCVRTTRTYTPALLSLS